MTTATNLTEPSTSHYDDETIPVFAHWFGSWRISLQRRALSVPQLTRFYDRAAPDWSEKLDRLGFPDAYERLLHSILRKEALEGPGARLRALDCGAGTGALSLALARVSPIPCELNAIDISPRMLERASSRLRNTGCDVSLRQGDVRDLPYDDAAFDLVMTGHVLEHLVDPGNALNEMARVLKPGGLLVACVTRRSSLGMYVQLKWRTHRVTPNQAGHWLRECGLEGVRSVSFGRRTVCNRLSVACVGRKPFGDVQY